MVHLSKRRKPKLALKNYYVNICMKKISLPQTKLFFHFFILVKNKSDIFTIYKSKDYK